MRRKKIDRMKLGEWLLRLLQGAIIGGAAILPSISGGVLCVVFGIYRPMMAVFAHPLRNLPRYLRLFIPVAIGWALGFLFFARLIERMFAASATLAVALFVGLIVGTFPALWRDAGKEGRGKSAIAAMLLSFVVFSALFFFIEHAGGGLTIAPGLAAFAFCGVLWGLSVVIPGFSSSSLLLLLGLFYPLAAGVAALDPAVLLPMFVGIIAVVLAVARPVNYLFERYYKIAFHLVVGLLLASTLPILPHSFVSVAEGLAALGCFLLGAALAWGMERLNRLLVARAEEKEAAEGGEDAEDV